jgi:putative pyruvate formate lyase activating enzyme
VERRRRLGWIELAVAAHRLAGGHRLDAHPATCELVEHGLRRAKLAVDSAVVLQPGHAAGLYSRSERYSRRTSRMAKHEPSSLALARSGVLAERARDALELLAHPCRVCPRECTVDRLADERGLCRIGRRAVVASHFPHFGEENCLRGWKGSGTIFFSGCNLRCVFCQNFDVSWQVQGEEVSRERLAAMMLELQGLGCHNINWVTPEHVVPQILEALPLALAGGLRLPIVYNTSSYDSLDSLRLMDGVVDIYMPDLKLWTQERARRYLGKREYADVMRANVKEMHRQVGDVVIDEEGLARRGLIVRHLVMPGLLDETEAILRFVADELGPDTYVNLMGQYYPAGRTDRYEEIDRRPRRDELERAFEIADGLGLRRLDPRSRRQALAAV